MFSFAACSEGLAPEAVEGWESMLYHIKSLAPVCDDLAGRFCRAETPMLH